MNDTTGIPYAIWELFRAELLRNLTPAEDEIRKSYRFLVEKKYSNEQSFEKIVESRLMAAFEAGINEYLHPPIRIKEANIKAEIIHIGSIVESLLLMMIALMLESKKLSITDIRAIAPKYPNPPTFKQAIDITYIMNIFDKDFYTVLNELRAERNNVHLSAVNSFSKGESPYEGYRVAKYRIKLDYLLKIMKEV